MTVAWYPPLTKGGAAKTQGILYDPLRFSEENRAARRASRLVKLEDSYDIYDNTVNEMTFRYGLGLDIILSLGEAAGKCSVALALLDDGMPVEYVLAMGEGQ